MESNERWKKTFQLVSPAKDDEIGAFYLIGPRPRISSKRGFRLSTDIPFRDRQSELRNEAEIFDSSKRTQSYPNVRQLPLGVALAFAPGETLERPVDFFLRAGSKSICARSIRTLPHRPHRP
jgi:hypothetical protein